jgi:hypothetical protein
MFLYFEKENCRGKSAADEVGERETQKRAREADVCDAVEEK